MTGQFPFYEPADEPRVYRRQRVTRDALDGLVLAHTDSRVEVERQRAFCVLGGVEWWTEIA